MTWWMWAVAAMVCIAIEIHFARDFSLLCVGISAALVGAGKASFPSLAAWDQWLSFSILSVATLLVARGYLRRLIPSRVGNRPGELDYLVGETAVACGDLPAGGFGRAELRGSIWSARNKGSKPVRKGQRCRVAGVEGLTIWLDPEC